MLGLLSLMAACDRDLYVGHDWPRALNASSDAGVVAPPPEPEPDAGVIEQTPVITTPALPPPSTCDATHLDCDGDPNNSGETDATSDREHCGSCGVRCETADCSCDNGKLVLHCASGRGDCDGRLNNGCETDLTSSMQHCGACQRLCHTNGHDVTSAMCTAGRCEMTCAPRIAPEQDCDGDPDNGCETYLLFDAKHCGACGNACAAGATCEAGVCS